MVVKEHQNQRDFECLEAGQLIVGYPRGEVQPPMGNNGSFSILIGKKVCSEFSGWCRQVGQRVAQVDRLGLGPPALFRYQYFSLPVMGDSLHHDPYRITYAER